jgi:DNA-directed RNA polymerase specialized sigma24 family protein
MPNASEIREEILGEFSLLFAEDGSGSNPDELDFFECRFSLAFRSFWIDFMRRETARAEQLVELPSENETPDSSSDDERLSRVSDAFQKAATQLPDIFLEELLNAIRSLPSDERKAVVLCCVFGYKEESDNPAETTAATLCGVSGRTIRNRLSTAAKKLSKFKEEVK